MLIFNSLLFTSSASSEDSIFEETRDQIVFDNLSVYVVNGNNLVVDVDRSVSLPKRISARREKEKYDRFIEKNKNNEKILLDVANEGNELVALGYTEVPLIDAGDHMDRVKKKEKNIDLFAMTVSAASTSKTGSFGKGGNGNFILSTTISRGAAVGNQYMYTATTTGEWLENSAVSYKNYPAGGNDFLFQTFPGNIYLDNMSALYNHKISKNSGNYGRNGTEYWRESLTSAGGYTNNVLKYCIKDDPVGIQQLKKCVLKTQFYGKPRTGNVVNSYYVHTWKSLNVKFSIAAGIGVTPQGPAPSIALEITPTIADGLWKVTSYVSYNF